MSSARMPSLGVASVTITTPGPCTVIVYSLPARSLPVMTLPSLSRNESCLSLVPIG